MKRPRDNERDLNVHILIECLLICTQEEITAEDMCHRFYLLSTPRQAREVCVLNIRMSLSVFSEQLTVS